jgi:type I site-specific restriction endonuclease
MFKVIAYITTGKVMIQGKGYEIVGTKFFSKCTDKLSKNLLLHNENKKEVWSELSKLTNQIKTTRICNKEASNTFDIQAYEKLMKDKDLVIQNLNGQIVSLKQENMSCREKVSSEQETIAKNFKVEMQKLRNEKLKIENENERLPIAIKMKSDNIDNMKHIYEESLHEKDKLVDNLHDRLQTQMYDVQGGPWINIPKQVARPIHNVSTTGRRDEPNKMGTFQLNTSNLNENNDTNRNMVNNSSSQGSYDIVMLHDSICKDIDINRLLRNTNRCGHKYTMYTMWESMI